MVAFVDRNLQASAPLYRPLRLLSRRTLLIVLIALQGLYWGGVVLVDRSATQGHVIGSDGLFYYEYLPALVIDHDLDFSKQRAMLRAEHVRYPWGAPWLQTTRVGKPATPFTIGWALLTLPFFLLAHGLSLLLAPVFGLPTNGYGPLYEGLTNGGAVLYGCWGVYLTYAALRRRVDESVAVLGALLVALASNAVYYIVVQPSMAHACGLFAVAGALDAALGIAGSTPRAPASTLRFAAFGLCAGLAFLVRPQLSVVAATGYLALAVAGHARRLLSVALPITIALGAIQCLVWWAIFGRTLLIPQGEGFLRFAQPQVLALLFSLRHGAFLWHPVYAFGLAGLVVGLFGRRRGLCIACLVAIATQVYVNAAVSDWWAQNSFGQRRFVDVLPLFAIGLALAIERIERVPFAVGLGAVLVCWNLLFLVQYRFGYIPRNTAITWRQLTLDKLMLPSLPRSYP